MSIANKLLQIGRQKLFTRSTFSRIVTGSGTLTPPTGAIGMRVAVIGGGGSGLLLTSDQCGGGGGGCAASNIVLAEDITYSIGAGGVSSSGGNTTASFTGYSLIGAGGQLGTSTHGGYGGTGTGGDHNFTGGTGGNYPSTMGAAAGGGAAGPNGAGGNGAAASANSSTTEVLGFAGTLAGTGWGAGGGSGGSCTGAYQVLGGSGPGQAAGIYKSGNRDSGIFGPDPATNWGHPGNRIFQLISPSTSNMYLYAGGEMGGGGSALDYDANGTGVSNGGSGGLVVEWFYVD